MRYYDQYLPSLYVDDSLEHSGTLGMKWGIRRYQNEDGSLTEAGKLRYGKKAASEYYKQHKLSNKRNKTDSYRKAMDYQRKMDKHKVKEDRFESVIDKVAVNNGRRIISSRKFAGAMAGTTLSAIAGGALTIAGASMISALTGGAAVPAFYGAGALAGATLAAKKTDLNYYRKERSTYNTAHKIGNAISKNKLAYE